MQSSSRQVIEILLVTPGDEISKCLSTQVCRHLCVLARCTPGHPPRRDLPLVLHSVGHAQMRITDGYSKTHMPAGAGGPFPRREAAAGRATAIISIPKVLGL